jgi:pyruvate dehydrogenase E2 component (dihydrolipoamide acetyltransferase)
MPTWVIMPKLGVNMTKGVIVGWLVGEGEAVKKGQPILEIETDKAVNEVEAPADGVLERILYPEGEVPCTYVVAIILAEGEEMPTEVPLSIGGEVPRGQVESDDQPTPPPPPPPPPGPAVEAARSDRVLISPAARNMAAELGVDYTTVAGTGPRGRIQIADVEAAAAALSSAAQESAPTGRLLSTPAARYRAKQLGIDWRGVTGTGPNRRIHKADVEAAYASLSAPPVLAASGAERGSSKVVPLSGVRGIIAERMLQSTNNTARVTLLAEADATQLVAWREQINRDYAGQDRIGFNELLILIVAHALAQFPYMNAALFEDGIHWLEEINVGVAVDTERGLLVPSIKHADRLGVFAIHDEFTRLVEDARSGRIDPADLEGGTFTVTNLGMYEITAFTPVINLPEIAILGVGQVAPAPVAVGDQVVIQQRVSLSLVFDHRLVDGAPAARFLQRVKHLVEAPYMLNTL